MREKVHLSSTVTKLQSRNEVLETQLVKRFEQFENLNAKLADNEKELVKLKEGERRRKYLELENERLRVFLRQRKESGKAGGRG
ncbi:hypothetical protein Naga_101901g1 [Nannochloropsis gaditana]|uniref:Uncharacterized protein n=1 Tax=Nannochloropsis gaditana TaxID=72520 RepID=W7TAQ3_9STRA|nr:hypothetical protein Naga_101901g1 [Nannochloropsis gaditana]